MIGEYIKLVQQAKKGDVSVFLSCPKATGPMSEHGKQTLIKKQLSDFLLLDGADQLYLRKAMSIPEDVRSNSLQKGVTIFIGLTGDALHIPY